MPIRFRVRKLKSRSGKRGILDLPEEVLAHIFCFLNVKERLQTELVCRRWSEFGKTVKWRFPTEFNVENFRIQHLENTPVTDNVLSNLLRRFGTSLKKLVFEAEGHVYQITSKVFDIIGECCPNLAEIRLWLSVWPKRDVAVTSSLVNLAVGCPKLHIVHIGYAECLDDSMFSCFLLECRSLECLVLTHSTVTETCFDGINEKLKSFYLYFCQQINPNVAAKKLMKRCDHIEELCLKGYGRKLDIDVLMKLLHYYKNTLKVLYLVFQEMKSPELHKIPDMLYHLEVLSLSCLFRVDVKFMKMLAEKCTKLRALDLSHTIVSEAGISALDSAPSLKVLNLSWMIITGEGIKAIASQGRLERLYLMHMYVPKSLIEESCISLAKCCPNTQLLDLRHNSNITDRLVNEFNAALESGYLKGPVLLRLAGTRVNRTVEVCDKLKLDFVQDGCDDFQEISYKGNVHSF